MPLAIDRIGPFQYRRFAPCQPPVEMTRHAVLIVGGGPVGLAMALGLARHGVPSVVIEADDSVCEGSRAACISRRSLEIVERLGAVDDFLATGLPWTRGRSYYGDQQVLVFDMPAEAGQKYPPMINLQQYYIEQYLLDAVERCNALRPGMIDIHWASQATQIDSRPEGVRVRVENALGSYHIDADWLVACDGGQSFVRRALGLELTGTGYEGRYVIIDIELASTSPTERRAWFDPPWWKGSTILMHRQPDNIWRIDYQLRPGESAEEALAPAQVRSFVQRHLDAIGEGHLRWQPVWTSVYRAGAMTLDSYRHGRVLFAGNAAHAMPIFGVRGLNSGFDDADNLAWKLAYVAQGRAGDALLDTYSSERVQAFRINAASAMRSTEFMSPPSRGFDLMREACLSLSGEHAAIATLINPRQTHAICYGDSPLSSPSDAFACGPAPGAPLQDALPGEGLRHLSTAVHAAGNGDFTLILFDEDGMPSRLMHEQLQQAGGPVRLLRVGGARCSTAAGAGEDGFAVLADPGRKVRQSYGAQAGSAYLVRPDGHIAGRWLTCGADSVQSAVQRALQRAVQVAMQGSTRNHIHMELPQ